MKKIFRRLLIFLILCFCCFQCGEIEKPNLVEKKRIAVINPDVSYFLSILNLEKDKIIDVPNIEFNVVVYSKISIDYKKLIDSLEVKNYPNVTLQIVEGDLEIEDLYQANSCSDRFYEIFKNTEGILFLGGDDISPPVYDQKTRISTATTDLYRHYFEASFLYHLIGNNSDSNHKPFLEEDPSYVVFGFCLGMQTMNVAAGGTMHQDIPQDIYNLEFVEDVLDLDINQRHKNYWYMLFPIKNHIIYGNFHRIQFTDPDFLTDKLFMESKIRPLVYSSHHQAVKSIGNGYQIIATSIDGKIIEAIKHEKYKNVLGVQFHPEFYKLYDPDSRQYKLTPNDSIMFTYHEIISKDESLQFHKKIWTCFSSFLNQ